jgi:hypothetical protein
MKKGSTLLLKGAIIIFGIAALAFCIFVLPRVIGSIDLGGYDPILLGMYVTAIPFFVALYYAFQLLNFIDRNNAFSAISVKALKKIKYCALTISGLYSVGMPYIFSVAEKDDAPGVVAIALIIISASFVVAVFAAVLQKLLQNAIDIKSENDLTV